MGGYTDEVKKYLYDQGFELCYYGWESDGSGRTTRSDTTPNDRVKVFRISEGGRSSKKTHGTDTYNSTHLYCIEKDFETLILNEDEQSKKNRFRQLFKNLNLKFNTFDPFIEEDSKQLTNSINEQFASESIRITATFSNDLNHSYLIEAEDKNDLRYGLKDLIKFKKRNE